MESAWRKEFQMSAKYGLSDRDLARRRARIRAGMMWHVGTFMIVNAFLWIVDLWMGQDGLQFAHWITGAWTIALLLHGFAWLIEGRDGRQQRAKVNLDRAQRATL